jgi:hypothetical protein
MAPAELVDDTLGLDGRAHAKQGAGDGVEHQ